MKTIVLFLMATAAWGQTPTPAQGRDYVTPAYRVIAVDTQGRLIISNSTGAQCTTGTPCVVVGEVPAGSSIGTSAPVMTGGSDGATVRRFLVDSAGRAVEVGAAASGAAVAGNPVLQGGSDGTNARTIQTDTAGRQIVAQPNATLLLASIGGLAAPGAPASNPVQTGFRDSSGNVLPDYGFPEQGPVSLAAATDVVVVAGVMGAKTYIGHLSMSADSGVTVTIREGTGTTCLTNTLAISGGYALTAALALDFTSKDALHSTVNGNDICLHFSGSVTAGGLVEYGTH